MKETVEQFDRIDWFHVFQYALVFTKVSLPHEAEIIRSNLGNKVIGGSDACYDMIGRAYPTKYIPNTRALVIDLWNFVYYQKQIKWTKVNVRRSKKAVLLPAIGFGYLKFAPEIGRLSDIPEVGVFFNALLKQNSALFSGDRIEKFDKKHMTLSKPGTLRNFLGGAEVGGKASLSCWYVFILAILENWPPKDAKNTRLNKSSYKRSDCAPLRLDDEWDDEECQIARMSVGFIIAAIIWNSVERNPSNFGHTITGEAALSLITKNPLVSEMPAYSIFALAATNGYSILVAASPAEKKYLGELINSYPILKDYLERSITPAYDKGQNFTYIFSQDVSKSKGNYDEDIFSFEMYLSHIRLMLNGFKEKEKKQKSIAEKINFCFTSADNMNLLKFSFCIFDESQTEDSNLKVYHFGIRRKLYFKENLVGNIFTGYPVEELEKSSNQALYSEYKKIIKGKTDIQNSKEKNTVSNNYKTFEQACELSREWLDSCIAKLKCDS